MEPNRSDLWRCYVGFSTMCTLKLVQVKRLYTFVHCSPKRHLKIGILDRGLSQTFPPTSNLQRQLPWWMGCLYYSNVWGRAHGVDRCLLLLSQLYTYCLGM